MNTRENEQGLRKILDMTRSISIVILDYEVRELGISLEKSQELVLLDRT